MVTMKMMVVSMLPAIVLSLLCHQITASTPAAPASLAASTASASASSSEKSTAALLACDDSFTRTHRIARAKLSAWKSRTARGLTVDSFGSAAQQLLARSMELYDRDTISAAGVTDAAQYRLTLREKLQNRISATLWDLFQIQVSILETDTLAKFNKLLLSKHGSSADVESFYNENAVALRSALFAFDTSISELEIPSLSLTKAEPTDQIKTKLNAALLSFPDSAAARLKDMKKITAQANKQRNPKTERKVQVGLDFVAMVRPDGFGSMQGFVGYQLAGNNVIVGVHNDADSPDVIGQFGGTRPPFVRVQPKLKLDVEL